MGAAGFRIELVLATLTPGAFPQPIGVRFAKTAPISGLPFLLPLSDPEPAYQVLDLGAAPYSPKGPTEFEIADVKLGRFYTNKNMSAPWAPHAVPRCHGEERVDLVDVHGHGKNLQV